MKRPSQWSLAEMTGAIAIGIAAVVVAVVLAIVFFLGRACA